MGAGSGTQLWFFSLLRGHNPVTVPVPFFAQWMEWHPQAHVLLAGTADGNSWMWKIPSGDCKTFQGPACPATCGKILPDGETQAAPVLGKRQRVWEALPLSLISVLPRETSCSGI